MRKIVYSEDVFEIEGFMTPSECDKFIILSEQAGYEEAKVNMGGAEQVMRKDIRNNERVLFNDADMARDLFEKSRDLLPQSIGNSILHGFNEFFRFYKYTPGQMFKKHRDGPFIRNEVEASYYTFMIYLNDDFEGGETWFTDRTIKPVKGNALVFLHRLLHEGMSVTEGTKYVLRTDVMYQLNPILQRTQW